MGILGWGTHFREGDWEHCIIANTLSSMSSFQTPKNANSTSSTANVSVSFMLLFFRENETKIMPVFTFC